MRKIKVIDIEQAFEWLVYEPSTGKFFQKKASKSWLAGRETGCSKNNGYRNVCIDGVVYLAHRVAFAMANGRNPIGQIDHVNGNRHDNRACNLREANQSENNQNQRVPRGRNKLMGAYANGNRWQAKLKINGKNVSLGSYATPEEANLAYIEGKKKYHPFFGGDGFPGKGAGR